MIQNNDARCFLKTQAIFIVMALFLSSCEIGKKAKSDIHVEFTQDTLNVGYTYWWPESGPFIGLCGEELSLVLIGTLTELKNPNDNPGPLYTSQKGVIKIEKVFKIKALGTQTYASQQYITTDCFYESGLTTGDQVLISCYDYEGGYTVPGGQSILKINGFEDPLINSIKTYIDHGENPLTIEGDLHLWADKNLGIALKNSIECRKELSTTH